MHDGNFVNGIDLNNNDTSEENLTRYVWKFSFFVAEKNKMRTVADGCRIKLLRILTEIRDQKSKLHSLSSYHLKTIFFHEIDQYQKPRDWNEAKLPQRFLSFLRRISDYLQNESCPCYFMKPPDFPSVNLFESILSRDLQNMQKVIDDIITNPIETLNSNGENAMDLG